MDKEKMGAFICTLRKEQHMTQKDMAEILCITDKAISKWERGLSFPDISMLEPIADLFQISVMELLSGERIEQDTEISVVEMKNLVEESLTISDDEIKRKHKKNKGIVIICIVAILFLISMVLNIINIMHDSGSNTERINSDSPSYEVIIDDSGNEVFKDQDAAIDKLISDTKNTEVNKYLIILKNSRGGEKCK